MDKFMGINLMFFYIGYYILVVLLYMYVWWDVEIVGYIMIMLL